MRRQGSLEDISDGKLYDMNSMVKADARGCDGCSACCHDVGDLVELNPMDVDRLKKATGQSFTTLLERHISLRKEGKLMLPFLKMAGPEKACSFLSQEGRCQVHEMRPDICRLFPLGRVYQKDDYDYFLQVDACVKPSLGKIKVKRWLGFERYRDHKDFIISWHQVQKAMEFRLKFVYDDDQVDGLMKTFIDGFYGLDDKLDDDFYEGYWKRLPLIKDQLGIL